MPCPPWLCREERGPASEPSCGCRAMGCVPQLLRQSPGRGSPPQGSQRAAHRRPGLACGCGVAPGPTGLQCPRASVSQAASSPHRRPAHSTQDAREWHRLTCRRSSGVAALTLLGLGPAFSEALPALGLLLARPLLLGPCHALPVWRLHTLVPLSECSWQAAPGPGPTECPSPCPRLTQHASSWAAPESYARQSEAAAAPSGQELTGFGTAGATVRRASGPRL